MSRVHTLHQPIEYRATRSEVVNGSNCLCIMSNRAPCGFAHLRRSLRFLTTEGLLFEAVRH